MKLFKNIYTFLVGENKDISDMYNYPLDNQAITNNLFVYDEFSFDKEEEVEEVEEVEIKKYWLYSEEYKDDFIEEFVKDLKQRVLL